MKWIALANGAVQAIRLKVPQVEVAAPDIVILGIGDSGTRGVKGMMQSLGVAMCHNVNPTQDNRFTMPAQNKIWALLRAAEGHVSAAQGYMRSDVFDEAVKLERQGAQQTRDCAIEDMGLDKNALPGHFRWGCKNPRHAYLMPVMDAAFEGKQKMLAVARDPRDLCTGGNRGQEGSFGHVVKLFEEVADFHHLVLKSEPNDDPLHRCLSFVAAVWTSVLNEYDHHDNFLVVRIEDLVIHDPITTSEGQTTVERMATHAGISPSAEQVQEQLNLTHEHRDSYMEQRFSDQERQHLEHKVASHEGPIHDVMRKLGYNVESYGLTTPQHPRVIAPR